MKVHGGGKVVICGPADEGSHAALWICIREDVVNGIIDNGLHEV